MTGAGIKNTSTPSVAHRRGAEPPAMQTRSQEGRDIIPTGRDRATGYGRLELHAIYPQEKQTIKQVTLAKTSTKEEISQLIARQLKVDILRPDCLEMAPDDWLGKKQLTARFQVDRPDLTRPNLVTLEQFRAHFDDTVPVFIATDGSDSELCWNKLYAHSLVGDLQSSRVAISCCLCSWMGRLNDLPLPKSPAISAIDASGPLGAILHRS
jgi:hypothetical protein